MKILFAATHCLLDPTSGAAISMRVLLSNLASMGHDVASCTATVFDSANGARSVSRLFAQKERPQNLLVHNAGVRHYLVPSTHWSRGNVTAGEMEQLDRQYHALLKEGQPDLVVSYGGMVSERFMLAEARDRGIATAFMLVNPSYHSGHYFKHVDHIFTDSPTTADRYQRELGLTVTPIGRMLDKSAVFATERDPQYVTFINPSFNKGVSLVARLALMCQAEAPDIRFLVVESRGQWRPSIETLGLSPDQFSNVTLIPTQNDMRSVYARTKALLIPSLWYESGARVGMEALVNSIPVLVESEGGTKDLLGDAGIRLDIPAARREAKDTLMTEDEVRPWLDELVRLFRDPTYYDAACARTAKEADAFDPNASAHAFLGMLDGTV